LIPKIGFSLLAAGNGIRLTSDLNYPIITNETTPEHRSIRLDDAPFRIPVIFGAILMPFSHLSQEVVLGRNRERGDSYLTKGY